MPEMIDLKRTKSEQSEDSALTRDSDFDDYGYGLTFNLEKEELDKLDIEKLEVGSEFEIAALVRVKSFSEDSNDDGGVRRSARLLIKSIALPSEGKDAAETLYGNDK